MTQNIAYAIGMGEGGPTSGGTGMLSIFPLMLILFIFYILLIRPQQKKERERLKMLAELKRGDRVVTQGGIYGTVVEVKENKVVLEVSERTKLTLAKNAISHKE